MFFLIFLFPFLIINICLAKSYKGAELRTKEAFLYGRFEVNYKASAGDGHVSTFFTYHEIQSTADWNEIDIEIHGRHMDDVQLTTIVPNQVIHLRHQYVSFNPHTDFHTYAFEWTPEYVAWFVDGNEVYRQTEEHIKTLTRPQKIMMNIWNPAYENWVGAWDERILPRFAYYDYVSYSSFTPGAGNTGTDHNFTLKWKDDFDVWDQNRWEKATHSFSGNNCDFTPENVVFKDGFMILCLTNNNDLGYQDKSAPAILWARANGNRIKIRFSEELDQLSAEKHSNYLISGVTIDKATLLPDRRTIELSVNGMDSSQSYTLYALNIKDTYPGNNSLLGQSTGIIKTKHFTFPIKINVGGSAYGDYLPDQEWNAEVEYGYLDGSEGHNNFQIDSTDEDEIFRSERNGLASYNVRVPNGYYRVTIMMAENYYSQMNQRYFDIFIEGELFAEHLDLFLGGFHSAYYLTLEKVQVQDEVLDIHFCAGIDHPLLNGLVIELIGTQVKDKSQNLPENYALFQNYPNPFNSSTTIDYFLKNECHVSLEVFDSLGNQISQLVNQDQKPGQHSVVWHRDISSGIYFCKMTVELQNFSIVKSQKMLLLQ